MYNCVIVRFYINNIVVHPIAYVSGMCVDLSSYWHTNPEP